MALLARAHTVVALLDVPCYHEPSLTVAGDTSAERNDPRRVAAVNQVLGQAAAADPSHVKLIGLSGSALPRRPRPTAHRRGQGPRRRVHYTEAGSLIVWRWLAPQLVALAPSGERTPDDLTDFGRRRRLGPMTRRSGRLPDVLVAGRWPTSPPTWPWRPPRPGPDFSIVPSRACRSSAVVIVGSSSPIAGNWLWALDFFHVVGGGLWTGIDLFVGLVIGPILGRLSIPARVEFSARFMPKMLLIMPTLVTMTLASGWQLARHLGQPQPPTRTTAGWSPRSSSSGVMAVIALGVLEPANIAVLFELRKPQPNGELIGKLMRRFVYTAGITGVMQVATLVIMTRLATW